MDHVTPEGLHEPLDKQTHQALRRAVVDHVRLESRRVHPAVLHVGRPGGEHAKWVIDPREPSDAGLATDTVAALRAAVPEPALIWLTVGCLPGHEPTGWQVLQDVDTLWLAAARSACAEAGVKLVFVIVTRHGWWDPRSGLARTWSRLRAGPRRHQQRL